MQAIILAGGLGTRLRPLTETVPKPLLPISGKTMIQYIIDSLPDQVDSVLLAVSYKADILRDYFSKKRMKLDVTIVTEDEPLGTGGAIKNVEKFIDGPFLVFNGDVISSLDLEELISFHSRKQGIGTISLWKIDDPSRYGVVDIDDECRIHRFLEKVPREEAPSDLINAGTYVLEPDILNYMEPDRKISIEREVFPRIIDEGLFGMEFKGYWVDAGTPPAYLKAQRIVLENDLVEDPCLSLERDSDTRITEPVFISEGCEISEGCALGPNVYLGPKVIIGRECRISESALMEGCVVGEKVDMRRSILGDEVVVGPGIELKDRVLKKGDRV